jgi:hypothetical protein
MPSKFVSPSKQDNFFANMLMILMRHWDWLSIKEKIGLFKDATDWIREYKTPMSPWLEALLGALVVRVSNELGKKSR